MSRRSIVSLAAAAAAVSAVATPLLAQAHDDYGYYEHQDWCTGRIHDNGVTGALLGGAAGALLGNNLARHGGRTGGTLLGAAAGAALGANVARSSTKDRCRGPRDVGYYGYAPPPPPPVYVAPRPVYVEPEPVYVAPPPPAYYGVYYEGRPHYGEWRHEWREHHHHHEHDEDDGD